VSKLNRSVDLRECLTAYECRDRLPALSAWMDADDLKLLPLYKGGSFQRGRIYFDLDNPGRGAFVADGSEGWITDHTYVCRDDVPEELWARLVTWAQPISEAQGQAIDMNVEDFGSRVEVSAAGEADTRPR
jgi:hypothetical protein